MRKMMLSVAVGLALATPLLAEAAQVQLRVSVENLASSNGVSFAPLRVGFHSGSYDAFNNGEVATAPIISVAEGGSGADWFPAFAAADPSAVLGSVLPNPAGPLLPGGTGSAMFTLDTSINRFFTFGAMVIPSNDHFIGNDRPDRFELFDANGNLQIQSISQRGRDIWDAGSEATDAANAAFLVGGVNDLRTPQNGVVSFDFAELLAFSGLTTAAGYVFDPQLSADVEIYRISFEIVQPTPVPLPAALPLLLSALGLASARFKRRA